MDLDLIKKLITVMDEHGLTELHHEHDGAVVRLSRQAGAAAPLAPVPSEMTAAAPASPPEEEEGVYVLKSPMVGTFYRRSSPDADLFVSAGDVVGDDTVLCLIEAMKVFNEIKAECSGTVLEILLEDGDSVEFDQPMFRLKTS
ncbi:MAG TPA: acetyl-CoA carboxylase biotin carboxyl carrier protein [Planctomycetes bacterium]|nr:acetyl-CoA carboxylase biotin carboxyl carrier protein [Planctomycetota bacterium]